MIVAKPRLNSFVPTWNVLGHVSPAALVRVVGMVSGRDGSSPVCARTAPGVATRSATPSASHRRSITSVFVEVLLDDLRVLRLQQRKPEQHARLLRVEPERGDGAEAVV